MKLSDKQIQRMIKYIFDELKSQSVVTFKTSEEEAKRSAIEAVKQNMADEKALDDEVMKMMDDLERQHQGEFQRFKMFPLLKQRLAKEKGFIL
ncbi:MAG: hypothetical protein CL677_08975 [Bdellovibrionaceae bacterium]|nr:hypothetical protein [Pseudobdellovibrionaceae bacterium]|tara:strand:- start:54561 stop:54839 length:279 start_codon:yes stop_codon:yes gene_type:complete